MTKHIIYKHTKKYINNICFFGLFLWFYLPPPSPPSNVAKNHSNVVFLCMNKNQPLYIREGYCLLQKLNFAFDLQQYPILFHSKIFPQSIHDKLSVRAVPLINSLFSFFSQHIKSYRILGPLLHTAKLLYI